jgi:hypothetical protein
LRQSVDREENHDREDHNAKNEFAKTLKMLPHFVHSVVSFCHDESMLPFPVFVKLRIPKKLSACTPYVCVRVALPEGHKLLVQVMRLGCHTMRERFID